MQCGKAVPQLGDCVVRLGKNLSDYGCFRSGHFLPGVSGIEANDDEAFALLSSS